MVFKYDTNKMTKSKSFTRSEKGFSFLELIVLITGIGILALIGMANLSDSSGSLKEKALAKKIIADIRYAQEMAINYGQLVQFIVETGQNRYSLKWQDNSYLQTPIAEKDFIVDVDDSYFSGVSISSTGFTSGTLQFNGDGNPLDNGTLLTTAKDLLQLNGATSIQITPGTGRCTIQ